MNDKKRVWLIRIVALVCAALLFGTIFIGAVIR